jgi:indole-3-glycerol phosphate synthase
MGILEDIFQVKKQEVKKLRSKYSYSNFNQFDLFGRKKLSLTAALNRDNNVALIAEIKKASPSAGIIKEDFNHLEIAEIYLENQVNAISILTDEGFFQGNINFLREVAQIKTVPILRKDFIIDEIQILQSKANGADAVLLISELLSKDQLIELTHVAYEADLEVLLELHSKDQLEKIDFEKNTLIGINNRNLHDFTVNIATTIEIGSNLPDTLTLVSESGYHSFDDIQIVKKTKINAILVGEHLMRANNLEVALAEFKGWCRRED